MAIRFSEIKDPHGYMSNFKKARFFIYGRWINNVETAFQSQKTHFARERDAIWACKTPREAKDLGQTVSLRSDWEEVKVFVMKECVMAKFLQHKDLRDQLMATGEEEIIEHAPWDNFWGSGPNGDGQNMLGKILMEVRNELRGE